jgi:allophanate hydrolase
MHLDPKLAHETSAKAMPKHVWINKFDQPLLNPEATGHLLTGLMFAVKDNMNVAGYITTAGCKEFGFAAKQTASVITKLLAEGATLKGKTNLDQFACGLNGTRSPYGACENAFDPLYISGGSSSGSAVAVATGEVDFALGTDTAGSGRVPAALNNLVGLKPSRGLISCAGVLPASQSIDCVSIFARTLETAITVLAVAQGTDKSDPFSRNISIDIQAAKTRFRFGVPAALEFFGDVASEQAFKAAVTLFETTGGTAVEFDYTPLETAATALYESAFVAERYLAIRAFFDKQAQDVFEPVRQIISNGTTYSAADLFAVQADLSIAQAKKDELMSTVDFLLLPTTPTTYTIAQMQADPISLNRNLGFYTNFVNLLDMAAISIPAGFKAPRLPFGITLVGQAGSDITLAQYADRFLRSSTITHLGAIAQPDKAFVKAPLQAKPVNASILELWRQLVGSSTSVKTHINTRKQVAVVGAHLSGMPLNSQLVERGAILKKTTLTAAEYELYALPNTKPPKPGIKHVGVNAEVGTSIAVEIWEMDMNDFGSFVSLIPAPLGIGTIKLIDGSDIQGFICEPAALEGAKNISSFGGWRNYINSLS